MYMYIDQLDMELLIFFIMHRDTPNSYTSVSLYQIAEKYSMYD